MRKPHSNIVASRLRGGTSTTLFLTQAGTWGGSTIDFTDSNATITGTKTFAFHTLHLAGAGAGTGALAYGNSAGDSDFLFPIAGSGATVVAAASGGTSTNTAYVAYATATAGVVSFGPLLGQSVAGRKSGVYYYGTYGIGGSSGAMATLNKLYATPFHVGDSQSFDRIAVANVTGVATAVMRVGLYQDSAGLPGALIVDAGTIDLSTGTGIKEVTISQTLSGKVWLALVPQVALPSAILRLGHIMLPEGGTTSPYSAFGGMAVSQTGVTAGLPDPWGSTVNYETTANTFAAVSMRKA